MNKEKKQGILFEVVLVLLYILACITLFAALGWLK
jgi:hypothetical protein